MLLKGLYEGRKEMIVIETADNKGINSIASTHRVTVAQEYEVREDINDLQVHIFCLPTW